MSKFISGNKRPGFTLIELLVVFALLLLLVGLLLPLIPLARQYAARRLGIDEERAPPGP